MRLIVLSALVTALHAAPDAIEIVKRSLVATQADWKAAPNYSFRERDTGPKGTRTFQVLMIEGSDYNRLTAINDGPLSPKQDAEEQKKLEREIQARKRESPSERAQRIAKYQRDRRQDHAMLREMIDAFNYKLEGETKIAGREVYVLNATPKPGYRPKSRDAKVLTGMRGKLWVDKQQYQWVKVEAEVVRPVSFAMSFAKVGPGTRFVLEQAPVSGNIWLPKHFAIKVNASVLGFGKHSSTDETYSDYRPVRPPELAFSKTPKPR